MSVRLTVLLAVLLLALAEVSTVHAQSAGGEADAIEVRVAARRLADGRTEFAAQQRQPDGSWSERLLPRARFFPASPAVGRWLSSTPLTVSAPDGGTAEIRVAARLLADGRLEFAAQQRNVDREWGERLLPRARFFPASPEVGRWLSSTPLTVTPQGTDPPPVIFVDDLDTETALATANAYQRARSLFVERFGTPEAPEIRAHVYVDVESLRETYRDQYGRELPEGWCAFSDGTGLHHSASCYGAPDSRIGERYFHALVLHIAPRAEVPEPKEGYSHYGPIWLLSGMDAYADAAYRSTFGGEQYDRLRTGLIAAARRTTLPLSSMASLDGRDAAGQQATTALGLLAIESLAERAGEAAILEYYRLLPSSASWQEAFESAFGLSAEGFYDTFEGSRFERAPLLPHLADPSDEPVFVFVGDVDPEAQEGMRASLQATRELVSGQFGSEATDFSVYVGSDLEAIMPEYLATRGHENPELCGDYAHGVIFQVISCKNPELVLAHEYVHVLQHELAGAASWGPAWLTEGVAVYGEALHRAVIGQRVTAGAGLELRRGWELARVMLAGEVPALSSLETVDDPDERAHYRLGFLAADWLAVHTRDEALAGFYRRLPASETWQVAFEEAFGLTVADFYETFANYAPSIAPLLPHLSDDREGPVVVFLGEFSPADRSAHESTVGQAAAIFSDRFGVGSAESTFFIGADTEALSPTHWMLFERAPQADFCHGRHGPAVIYSAACDTPLDSAIGPIYYDVLLDGIAPWAELPVEAEGYRRHGPEWLVLGVQEYALVAYQAAVGGAPFDDLRAAQASRARQTAAALGDMETDAGRDEAGWLETAALGFLAADSLVELAGDRAIFEYFRLLSSSASWQDAFEAAFGLTVDDFYTAFAAHRADVAPPLPHLAVEGEGTAVLFVGDVPAETQAEARSVVERVRTFFAERFGAEAANLRVYVGADRDEVDAIYRGVFGRALPEAVCSNASAFVVVAVTPCGETFESAFTRAFGNILRYQLAPLADLPGARHESYGPTWLISGGIEYAHALYYASVGDESYGDLRSVRLEDARRVNEQLSSFEAPGSVSPAEWWDVAGLGFVAIEQLAERAGNEAVFEYFRLLPVECELGRTPSKSAFGLTISDFYTAFEARRAEIAAAAASDHRHRPRPRRGAGRGRRALASVALGNGGLHRVHTHGCRRHVQIHSGERFLSPDAHGVLRRGLGHVWPVRWSRRLLHRQHHGDRGRRSRHLRHRDPAAGAPLRTAADPLTAPYPEPSRRWRGSRQSTPASRSRGVSLWPAPSIGTDSRCSFPSRSHASDLGDFVEVVVELSSERREARLFLMRLVHSGLTPCGSTSVRISSPPSTRTCTPQTSSAGWSKARDERTLGHALPALPARGAADRRRTRLRALRPGRRRAAFDLLADRYERRSTIVATPTSPSASGCRSSATRS